MRRITDPDGGGSNPSVRASSSREQPCCTNCLRCRARLLRPENEPGPSITRDGRRSWLSSASPPALLIHTVSPRSSTDRAPSFYLGTVRVRVLPRAPSLQSQCVHVAQWTRAEASEASGCAFESRRGLHFDNDMSTNGELAERQGTAVLTRRDLRVGQVRLLHSPPSLTHLFLDDHHDRSSRRLHQSVDLGHVKPEDDGALR